MRAAIGLHSYREQLNKVVINLIGGIGHQRMKLMDKRIAIAVTGTLALSLAAGLFAPAARGESPSYPSFKGEKQGQLNPESKKANLSQKNLKTLGPAGPGKPQLKRLKPPANNGKMIAGPAPTGFNKAVGSPPP
jgi:hypothetical protein